MCTRGYACFLFQKKTGFCETLSLKPKTNRNCISCEARLLFFEKKSMCTRGYACFFFQKKVGFCLKEKTCVPLGIRSHFCEFSTRCPIPCALTSASCRPASLAEARSSVTVTPLSKPFQWHKNHTLDARMSILHE